MAGGPVFARHRGVRAAKRRRAAPAVCPFDRRRDGAAVGGLVSGAARRRCFGLAARRAATNAAGSAGAERVQQALAGTHCAVELAADFTSVAWRKLLQNAVAGLMVLTGRRAGMFAREEITALGLAYLRECLQVARAEGAVLSDSVPEEIIAGFHRAPADLSTSILIDRLHGRPLEWDIRNGVVQRRGRQHGIPTPLSDIIVPLLAAASDGPG